MCDCGMVGATPTAMDARCAARALLVLLPAALVTGLQAANPDLADTCIRQFLSQDDTQPAYRAVRRLEAENGKRSGWLEAVTEYSPDAGFRYEVTGEGGSEYIRSKVLHAVLDGEREVVGRGETRRSSLAVANYTFQVTGVGEDGLVSVLLSPRRRERVLVSGRMFLAPGDGRLVRLEGQLAKSPSFWITNVTIVRTYDRIAGRVMPVAMESHAQMRMLGRATLRMTYQYSHVNGRLVSGNPVIRSVRSSSLQ
jgi:hypothetical protein